jgi:hypothetical protein
MTVASAMHWLCKLQRVVHRLRLQVCTCGCQLISARSIGPASDKYAQAAADLGRNSLNVHTWVCCKPRLGEHRPQPAMIPPVLVSLGYEFGRTSPFNEFQDLGG